ncbi:acyl-coenzyme A:6-aminopenicillanic-acid-acyltransferase 40 kDa form-like isoform X2 [Chenopodium quinoa]|uniref:acyl-coenzyme A:6-aminopenicillanic-acid-acyltransferase 40 kDa form-like isoform X2 n=1 Tax=Chenopodium quinoa TaxID=63459 RepID=UPI000B79317B|nr:acyl-coenzyme A:6-aminopenicillanic-acid-acyltransferase 40 kDa form-like isoform X2 [Chenopodium quinoa]
MEIFEVGPCNSSYEMGYLIGERFSSLIKSRLAADLILQTQLRPYAKTHLAEPLIDSLTENNRSKFPRYWDELVGIAEGSGVPVLDIILINFRKEILAFMPKNEGANIPEDTPDDCSTILVVSRSMAIAAHNEDANIALVGHTYLIQANLGNGLSFTAYTYAGELPSCAFGFNSHGLAFTLNSVPPREDEIVAGGIGRNFISRDLLEATSSSDALKKIQSSEVSIGHSYNLIDISKRNILNIETASRNRFSVYEVYATPFFHANMYLHLQVPQIQDENSSSRQKRAAALPQESKEDFLSLLGDIDDKRYPIYMSGPTLYTLCTAVFDLDGPTLSIIEGNPKEGKVTRSFHM